MFLRIFFLFLFASLHQLFSYQIHEPFLHTKKVKKLHQKLPLYEKTLKGLNSSVEIIDHKNFYTLINEQSNNKLLIIKIHHNENQDAKKMTPIFQEIAKTYKNEILCCSVNIKKIQNRMFVEKLIKDIGIKEKLSKKNGLMFLFYSKGFLQLPIKKGFDIKDNFVKIIKNKLSQNSFL
jgi:hypothetical protein